MAFLFAIFCIKKATPYTSKQQARGDALERVVWNGSLFACYILTVPFIDSIGPRMNQQRRAVTWIPHDSDFAYKYNTDLCCWMYWSKTLTVLPSPISPLLHIAST